jgi:carbon-monoxide dehydrogenase large subunit
VIEMQVIQAEGLEGDAALRFVSGRGRFVDDMHLEGMMYLHVVRSPYARARVVSVQGGITGKELSASLTSVGEDAEGEGAVAFPVLATRTVNYVGQPVAAVLAEDRYEAEDRAEEVEVRYEPLKPVVNPELSLSSEPIHQSTKSNLVAECVLGEDFELRAPVEIEETLSMERVSPNPLETRGVLATYDGRMLTVYGSTQSVFAWRDGLSSSLGLPKDSVRVVQVDTGGAFGSKGGIYPEYVIASYAAMKLRRPVKWVESRYEHLMATNQGRGVRARMKLFASRSGKVLGLKAELLIDNGAYPLGSGSYAPRWISFQLTGPYAIPRAYVQARSVYTNKVPLGPYRGAGRPEAAFFIERMMDRLADELGLDPAEVRLRNASTGRHKSELGLEIGSTRPFLKEALTALGYGGRQRRKERLGLSFFVLVPAASGGESAKIRVEGGRVKVWLGGSSHGQGHDVFARKIVSEELGVDMRLVDFEGGDTGELEKGVGTWGSRSAMLGGAALVEAARKLRAKARERGGRYSPEELLRGRYESVSFFEPESSLVSLGANLVRAKVDKLGGAYIHEVAAYYDVGVPLNPSMVESQITGGAAQAVGEVLYERALYGDDGQLLTGSIADAGIPHTTDMPEFVVKLATHKSSLPHGAKGVGESPTIGVPPAATRALEVAMGKRFTGLPIALEKLWTIIRH